MFWSSPGLKHCGWRYCWCDVDGSGISDVNADADVDVDVVDVCVDVDADVDVDAAAVVHQVWCKWWLGCWCCCWCLWWCWCWSWCWCWCWCCCWCWWWCWDVDVEMLMLLLVLMLVLLSLLMLSLQTLCRWGDTWSLPKHENIKNIYKGDALQQLNSRNLEAWRDRIILPLKVFRVIYPFQPVPIFLGFPILFVVKGFFKGFLISGYKTEKPWFCLGMSTMAPQKHWTWFCWVCQQWTFTTWFFWRMLR